MNRTWTQHLKADSYPGEKPDFVKSASYQESYDGLKDDQFALIWMQKNASYRMLPISSPETTWLSADYLGRAWLEFPEDAAFKAAANIAEAAQGFGVEIPEMIVKAAEACDDRDRLYTYAGSSDIENLMSKSIADEMTSENTLKIAGKDYPIRNPAELNAAEHYFERNHEKLGHSDRMKLAYFIEYSKSNLGINEKTAEEIFSSPAASKYSAYNEFNQRLDNELLKRASLCSRTSDHKLNIEIASTYIKLAGESKLLFDSNPIDVIEAIENLDKTANLGYLWDKEISNPIDAVLVTSLSTEQKTAEDDLKSVSKIAGMEDAYSVADSLNISTPNRDITFGDIRKSASSGRLSNILGDDLAQALSSNPMQTFDALPDHMKQVVLHESFRG